MKDAYKEIDSLDSVKKSFNWYNIYRVYLYRSSEYHDGIRKRLNKYMAAAKEETDIIMKKYNIDVLYLDSMENGMGLSDHVPYWRDFPFGIEVKIKRSYMRYDYWRKRGNDKFAELHYLRHIALAYLDRPSWPVTKHALNRAKKWKEKHDGAT
jgi:hypothetical protein